MIAHSAVIAHFVENRCCVQRDSNRCRGIPNHRKVRSDRECEQALCPTLHALSGVAPGSTEAGFATVGSAAADLRGDVGLHPKLRRLGRSDTCEFQFEASESASRAADRSMSRLRWKGFQAGCGGLTWSWCITVRNGL